MKCDSKVVVFDLDETLGYYTEYGLLWESLNVYLKSIKSEIILDQTYFNSILDLYPEFNRPNIIKILKYLKQKKLKNCCNKLLIYTNNQGPIYWSRMLITYFETKIKYKLFDQIISAFKIQGQQIETGRTTHLKTHKDLLKCGNIPDNTQICFLDDVYYPDMNHDNVYYINLKPYEYNLKFNDIINRFIDSEIIPDLPTNSKNFLLNYMEMYAYTYKHKTDRDLEIDNNVSKQILSHLNIFFNNDKGKQKTRKNNKTKTKTKKTKTKKTKN